MNFFLSNHNCRCSESVHLSHVIGVIRGHLLIRNCGGRVACKTFGAIRVIRGKFLCLSSHSENLAEKKYSDTCCVKSCDRCADLSRLGKTVSRPVTFYFLPETSTPSATQVTPISSSATRTLVRATPTPSGSGCGTQIIIRFWTRRTENSPAALSAARLLVNRLELLIDDLPCKTIDRDV